MGSLRFEGVRFSIYSDDHSPPHVHCFYADQVVIVDLLRNRTVALARRKGATTARNVKRSDVNYILDLAAEHFDALLSMWDSIHG